MDEYKTISQLNKSLTGAFSSPSLAQTLKLASTISSMTSTSAYNDKVTSPFKQAMMSAPKFDIPHGLFIDRMSTTPYSASIQQASSITGIASRLTSTLKASNIVGLASVAQAADLTESLKKSIRFSNQSEFSKMISNATRTNMQSAIAWDRLSKIINGSFIDFENTTQISRHPSVKVEEMDKQSHQGTSDLENSEAVFEDIKWSPTETSSDNNVDSKDFKHENIDFEKYFSDLAQQLSDDGYGLPSVVQMLLFTALSINNFLKTVKDETELYLFWGNVIWWIYYGITHIH